MRRGASIVWHFRTCDVHSSEKGLFGTVTEKKLALQMFHIIYIYIDCNLIRYVYSIDHVTCSTYVCICAAAILVLLATFELTE